MTTLSPPALLGAVAALVLALGARQRARRGVLRHRLDVGRRDHWLIVLTAGLVVVALIGVVAAAALALCVGLARFAPHARRRAVAQASFDREFPDLLSSLSSSLRAGRSLGEAVASAGELPFSEPLAAPLARVVAVSHRGGSVPDALRQWASRSATRDVARLAAIIEVAWQSGGPVAGAIEGFADTLRQRRAVGREIEAQAAQARFSAMVLVALPVLFVPVLVALGVVDPLAVLAHPAARLSLVLGVALDVIGVVWIRRLIDGIAP